MSGTDLLVPGGVPIAVRDLGGDGPDVLLLHGAGRNLEDWGCVAPLLVASYRLVSMDVRGHGASGDGDWDWDAVLDDVDRVIDRLGLWRPAVVGHSMGGMIAARWAAARPECPGAVNLDGHGLSRIDVAEGYEPSEAVHLGATLRRHRAEAAARATASAGPVQDVERCVTQQQQALVALGVDAAVGAAGVRRGLVSTEHGVERHPSLAILREVSSPIDEQDLLAIYPRTLCPLLIVSVTGVESVPPVEAGLEWVQPLLIAYRDGLQKALDALAAAHPLVEHQTMEGSHGMVLTQPQQTAARLDAFLRRL